MRSPYRFTFASLIIAAGLSLATTAASATTFTITVDGVESFDARGDTSNTEIIIDVGALLGVSGPVSIVGLGWNVDIDTVGASWLSEVAVGFEDSAGNEYVDLRPGIDDTLAGSSSYDSGGIIDLVEAELSFTLTDGLLHLVFFETFDDVNDAADAIWNGALEIRAVPVPPAVLLFASALSALGFARRRRSGR